MRFKSIRLKSWRQFADIDIDLHPRLTVITGANAVGKSTILSILGQHFGINKPYLSTPISNQSGEYSYDLGLHKSSLQMKSKDDVSVAELEFRQSYSNEFMKVGEIEYENLSSSAIGLYETSNHSYVLEIKNQQSVSGLHIGSHRTPNRYQKVEGITWQSVHALHAYNYFNQEILNIFNGNYTGYGPTYRMKEAIIGMAAFGEGNSYLQRNEQLLEIFNGFVNTLKNVLPDEIGFERMLIRMPDIVLQTKTGEFLLDSSSGGLTAIIETIWYIYLFYHNHKLSEDNSFVVTIDEPENHLHPSMQRSIIPALLDAFPSAQFIVATHSPFIVSAVEDSNVYVLNYGDEVSPQTHVPERAIAKKLVYSFKLDKMHKGGTAGEILREVLGVPVTTPKWVEAKLKVIIEKYRNREFTNKTLAELRNDLSEAGLEEFYSDAVSSIVK